MEYMQLPDSQVEIWTRRNFLQSPTYAKLMKVQASTLIAFQLFLM